MIDNKSKRTPKQPAKMVEEVQGGPMEGKKYLNGI